MLSRVWWDSRTWIRWGMLNWPYFTTSRFWMADKRKECFFFEAGGQANFTPKNTTDPCEGSQVSRGFLHEWVQAEAWYKWSNLCCVSCNVGIVLDGLVEKGAEPEDKTPDLLVDLSNTRWWPWPKEWDHRCKWLNFLHSVSVLSLKEREPLRHPGGALSCFCLTVRRSQWRWFRRLIWMPPGKLPVEIYSVHPT